MIDIDELTNTNLLLNNSKNNKNGWYNPQDFSMFNANTVRQRALDSQVEKYGSWTPSFWVSWAESAFKLDWQSVIKDYWLNSHWFDLNWKHWDSENTWTDDSWNRYVSNREVSVGLWIDLDRLNKQLTSKQKELVVNSLTDEQYQQYLAYKDQWYTFNANIALIENQDKLGINPLAEWQAKYDNYSEKLYQDYKNEYTKKLIKWEDIEPVYSNPQTF